MKPFNLNEALSGHKVCTRDGRSARIICFDRKGDSPIVALVDNDGKEITYSYYLNGRFFAAGESSGDLMMASEEHKGWIYLCKCFDNTTYTSRIFSTKEEAELEAREFESKSFKIIDIIEITWED